MHALLHFKTSVWESSAWHLAEKQQPWHAVCQPVHFVWTPWKKVIWCNTATVWCRGQGFPSCPRASIPAAPTRGFTCTAESPEPPRRQWIRVPSDAWRSPSAVGLPWALVNSLVPSSGLQSIHLLQRKPPPVSGSKNLQMLWWMDGFALWLIAHTSLPRDKSH